MPKECVCERKDVHAYCSKMLAAQQKKTMPWLNHGRGGGTMQGGATALWLCAGQGVITGTVMSVHSWNYKQCSTNGNLAQHLCLQNAQGSNAASMSWPSSTPSYDCRHHKAGVLLDIVPVEEKCCSCLLTIAPTAATLLVEGLHCGRHAVVNHTGDVRTV